jgi:hypothetical protein
LLRVCVYMRFSMLLLFGNGWEKWARRYKYIDTQYIYKKMEKGKTLRYNRWRVPPGVIQLIKCMGHTIYWDLSVLCAFVCYISTGRVLIYIAV